MEGIATGAFLQDGLVEDHRKTALLGAHYGSRYAGSLIEGDNGESKADPLSVCDGSITVNINATGTDVGDRVPICSGRDRIFGLKQCLAAGILPFFQPWFHFSPLLSLKQLKHHLGLFRTELRGFNQHFIKPIGAGNKFCYISSTASDRKPVLVAWQGGIAKYTFFCRKNTG